MGDITSFQFDMDTVDDFMDQWNIKFLLSDMAQSTTANKFKIIIAESCRDNIDENIDANGQLRINESDYVESTQSQYLKLLWKDDSISIRDNVQFNLGDSFFSLRGVFITTNTNYVMGYCINNNPMEITNKLVFDAGTILWSIVQ